MTTPVAIVKRDEDSKPYFGADDLALIKKSVANDANADEFAYFIRVASLRQLNPLLGQIRLTVYNKNNPDTRSAVIVTTIHGLRLIAARTGCYAPGQAATYTYDKSGKPESATAYVQVYHRQSNTWHEYSDTAYFAEYGKAENLWRTHPRVMLAKCAEALALRRGFPEQMGGLYTDDEMDQAAPPPPAHNAVTGEIVEARVIEQPRPRPAILDTPAPGTPADPRAEYKRLHAKCVNDLGFVPEIEVNKKDGGTELREMPAEMPANATPAQVETMVNHLHALVTQAEDMQADAA
jgi:phage recombination protein Bet